MLESKYLKANVENIQKLIETDRWDKNSNAKGKRVESGEHWRHSGDLVTGTLRP